MAKPRANRQPNTPTAGSLLGEWIRKTRMQHGLSQRALADQSGLSRSYVCDIERGRGSEPSLATLDKIATALGTSRSTIMQAAGLIDRALIPRETDEERRLLSVYRDVSDDARKQIMHFARFLHQEEHTFRQATLVDADELEASPRARRHSGERPLPLFDLES